MAIDKEVVQAVSKHWLVAFVGVLFFALYWQQISHVAAMESQRHSADNRMESQRLINSSRLEQQRDAEEKRIGIFVELTQKQFDLMMDRQNRDHALYVQVLGGQSDKLNILIAGQSAIASNAILIEPGDSEQIRDMIDKAKNTK